MRSEKARRGSVWDCCQAEESRGSALSSLGSQPAVCCSTWLQEQILLDTLTHSLHPVYSLSPSVSISLLPGGINLRNFIHNRSNRREKIFYLNVFREQERITIMGNILSLFFPQQPAVSAKTEVRSCMPCLQNIYLTT